MEIVVVEAVSLVPAPASEDLVPVAQRVVYTECVVVILECPLRQGRICVVIQELCGPGSPWIREVLEKRLGHRVDQLGGDLIADNAHSLVLPFILIQREWISRREAPEWILDKGSANAAPRIRVINLILPTVRQPQEGRKIAVFHRDCRNGRRRAVISGPGVTDAFIPKREEGFVAPVIELRNINRTG